MGFPWSVEETLEPHVALQLIREQFPELNAEKIRLLGVGWDNTAYLINEEFIFRFPRRLVALDLLEAEWHFLREIASALSISIPYPEWKGAPSDKYPWPFIGYKRVPGFTACYANLSENDRAQLASPLAMFLRQLHSIKHKELESASSFDKYLHRIAANRLKLKIAKSLDELQFLGLLEDTKILRQYIADETQYRQPIASAIVHGDFYVRHLLVNEKHHLVGVIDWGDMHYGDPAIDISLAHSFLPLSAHNEFRKCYGDISEETWQLAKLRAIHSTGLFLLYGHHSGDPDLVREALRSFRVLGEMD